MKIGGVEVTKCEEVLVLPRQNGNNIVFRARATSINKEFDELVPEPVAPMLQKKGGQERDVKDKNYVEAVIRRHNQRFAYLCIRSLEPSEIEWTKVDLAKPNSWLKWTDELLEAGLSEQEVNRVVSCVMAANALDEEKLEEARKAFLRGQEG